MTSTDVGARLGITGNRVNQLRQMGRLLPAMKLSDGVYVYAKAEVERFAKEHAKMRRGRPRREKPATAA